MAVLTPNKWEQNKSQVLALLLRTESHCGSGGQYTLYFTYTAVVDSSRWVVLHPVFLFILFSLTGLIGGVGDVSRPMAIFELLEYIVEEVRIFPPFFLSLLSVSWLRTPVYLYVGYLTYRIAVMTLSLSGLGVSFSYVIPSMVSPDSSRN